MPTLETSLLQILPTILCVGLVYLTARFTDAHPREPVTVPEWEVLE